jgi:hypothetical protein
MTVVFRNVIRRGELSTLDDRFATIALEGVGPVVADAQERTLVPLNQEQSDVVIDWAWVDSKELCRQLDRVEAAASELFGTGPWRWKLDVTPTYHVCKDCCA